MEILHAQQIPLVTLDCSVPEVPHQVVVDRAIGIRQAVAHLAELGHRHVALITNQWALDHPISKVASYLECLQCSGLRVSVGQGWTIESLGEIESQTKDLVKARFASGTDLPTALVLLDDACAIAAIRGLAELDLRVPRDVSVVGFNDVNVASFVTPSLTTIRQPREEVGKAACQMLLDMLEDPDSEGATIEFPCTLIVRESTGARGQLHESD
jgi:DNA-binding LacI/PurR family transcriptional regulator